MFALFTDFGVEGPYLGQLKAALYRDAPGIPVVDIFSDLPPFNVKAAAYLLMPYARHLPGQTVCVCVVDPGVGTARRALAVQADQRWYIGPDNGLFTLLLRWVHTAEVFEISWRPDYLSNSFHGRDLFAPVAARLARGGKVPGTRLQAGALTRSEWPDDLPEVVYLDHYGNAVTGMRAARIDTRTLFEIAGRECRFRRVFGEAPPDEPFWYENSNGLVEIAFPEDSAASRLGLSVGQPVRIKS